MVTVITPTSTQEPTIWVLPDAPTDMWRFACDQVSVPSRLNLASTVAFDVSVAVDTDDVHGVRTMYTVQASSSLNPGCSFSSRINGCRSDRLGVADAAFEDQVCVQTADVSAMASFLNAERCEAILNLMATMPTAQITDSGIVAWSNGVEQDASIVEQTMRVLIEVAEVIQTSWLDVRLTEQSVLEDLFNSDREVDEISCRFDDLYFGNTVNWVGEVLQVGAVDSLGRRALVFIGTADGKTSETGRVVAHTALDPEIDVQRGDVVNITGALWNLDAKKRFFRID